MTSKYRTRLFLQNYCSGNWPCECIQLKQEALPKSPNSSLRFTTFTRSVFIPVLDMASEGCPRGQRRERTTALSFLQKTISSSGRGAPGGSPPRSPRSRAGSAHSPRGGSRMWSVLRDLRGTRNAVTIGKRVPPVHASTRPSDTASTDCSPGMGSRWNWIQPF